jgi:hypothetical protein
MTVSLPEVSVIICQVTKHHIPGDMSLHQHWYRTSNLAHFKMYTDLWVWMFFPTSEYQVYKPWFGEKMNLWLQSSKVHIQEFAEFPCRLVLQWHRYGWFCVVLVFLCVSSSKSTKSFTGRAHHPCTILWMFPTVAADSHGHSVHGQDVV